MSAARWCVVAVVAAAPGLLAQDPPMAVRPAAGVSQAVEELVAEKDPACPARDEEDVSSADGRRIAWRAPAGQKWSAVVNGVRQGATYDEVRGLFFSPDGEHFAFAARNGRQWAMVIDGTGSGGYDDIGAPVFSSQGGRLAYGVKRDKRWLVVDNGKEGTATYADLRLPTFSKDGTRIAFSAKPEKKWVLVVDGVPGRAEFDAILMRTFSPDGQRAAYVGRRRDKFIAVLDDAEGTPFDILGGAGFSEDGRRFAYAGADVKRGFGKEKALGRVVIDGAAGPPFEGSQVGSLLKNAMSGSTPHLRLGYFERLLSDLHGVTAPAFSADGRRVAYAARRDKDAAAVVMDGEGGATLPTIVAGPVFSADGQHVAIVVSEKGTLALLVDGKRVAAEQASGTDFVTDLAFAPDGRRVAYIGIKGGSLYDQGFTARARRRVYLDGAAGTEFNAKFLGRLRFTPDGDHVVYVVAGLDEGSRDVAFVVADSQEGKRYDDVFGRLRFAEDGRSVSYSAQAGRKFYVVTQPLVRTPTM